MFRRVETFRIPDPVSWQSRHPEAPAPYPLPTCGKETTAAAIFKADLATILEAEAIGYENAMEELCEYARHYNQIDQSIIVFFCPETQTFHAYPTKAEG